MAKKDNIINFRDYQPGKRETIETNSLDEFRETLYDLGFLGPSSSDTLDELKEVEPKVEETEHVSASEVVEEPTVEVEVEETEAVEEPTVEVEETTEPAIVDEDDSDDDDFLYEFDEEDDDEEIKEEPDKFKAPEGSLSDLIIQETERGFRRFDSDEPLVEDDDSDEEVIVEADFMEVDFDPEEEDSSEFEEEPHTSKTRTSSFGRFFKKFEKTNFAERILSNFGLGETPAVQPIKVAEKESKAEDSTAKAEKFNSKAQELLSREIIGGKLDRLEAWSKNGNVNKLMFLFSGNPVLSDWLMENVPDLFWDLPDEVIDVILEKNKKSSEKKDDKGEKKS